MCGYTGFLCFSCVRTAGPCSSGGLILGACRKGGGGFRMVAESAPTDMRVKSAG